MEAMPPPEQQLASAARLAALEREAPVATAPTEVLPELPTAPRERAPVLLEPELAEALPTFELFFKTFGFKRIHGRIWGLLVLCGRPLSSREIADELGISLAATSTSLNELSEWRAITTEFDSARHCHLHGAVGNALSIVATVMRRREQVAFQQFKLTASRAQEFIRKRHGERDPRVLTLRSIIATCDLADAVMQLVLSSVASALGDPESLLARAMSAAFKAGLGAPARALFQNALKAGAKAERDRSASSTPAVSTKSSRRARRGQAS